MGEASAKFSQMTLWDSPDAISSLECSAGNSPSNSRDGQTTDPSGRDHARVSLSRQRAREKAKKTNAICGRPFDLSSPSAVLQRSLASKLAAMTDVDGSPEYSLTWKRWVLPSGLRICRLHARARRTSDRGFSGWPTPRKIDATSNVETPEAREKRDGRTDVQNLSSAVLLTGWPTPMTPNGGRTVEGTRTEEGREGKPQSGHLEAIAILAGWATPQARDHFPPHTQEYLERKRLQHANAGGMNGDLPDQAALVLSGWATPGATDYKGESTRSPGKERPATDFDLPTQTANLVGWATPRATDAENNVRSLEGALAESERKGPNNDLGTTSMLCHAGTGPSGVLSPAHSRWLQGYPREWDEASPHYAEWRDLQQKIASGDFEATETPSALKSPPSSSEPSSKPSETENNP